MARKKKKKNKPRTGGDGPAAGTEAPGAEAKDEQPKTAGEQALEWWRGVRGILIAVTIALLLRWYVVEPFKIPTSSMEPTLIGHEDFGDRVVTFKPGSGTPERNEVYVFTPPHERGRKYIKRVVGLPNETITIYGGDIFANGEIARKPVGVQEDLWHLMYALRYDPRLPRTGEERAGELPDGMHWQPVGEGSDAWRLGETGALVGISGQPAFLAYQGRIDNLYIRGGKRWLTCPGENGEERKFRAYIDTPRREVRCPDGGVLDSEAVLQQLHPEVLNPAGDAKPPHGLPDVYYPWATWDRRDAVDVRLSVDAEIDGDSRLLLRLAMGETRIEASFSRDGRVRLTQDGEELTTKADAFDANTRRFSIARVDYQVRVRADGELLLEAELPQPALNAVTERPAPTRPMVGVADGTVRIGDIEIERDLYYLPIPPNKIGSADPHRITRPGVIEEMFGVRYDSAGRPFFAQHTVRPGHYFFMGDNSPSSYDSRAWGDVPDDALIGQAHLVLWPISRWRLIE